MEKLKGPHRLHHTNTRVRSISHGVNTSGCVSPVCAAYPTTTWQLITQTPKGFIGAVLTKGEGPSTRINTQRGGRKCIHLTLWKPPSSLGFHKGPHCQWSVATPASQLWLCPYLWLLQNVLTGHRFSQEAANRGLTKLLRRCRRM